MSPSGSCDKLRILAECCLWSLTSRRFQPSSFWKASTLLFNFFPHRPRRPRAEVAASLELCQVVQLSRDSPLTGKKKKEKERREKEKEKKVSRHSPNFGV